MIKDIVDYEKNSQSINCFDTIKKDKENDS